MLSALASFEGSVLTLGRAPYGLQLAAEDLGFDTNVIFDPRDVFSTPPHTHTPRVNFIFHKTQRRLSIAFYKVTILSM